MEMEDLGIGNQEEEEDFQDEDEDEDNEQGPPPSKRSKSSKKKEKPKKRFMCTVTSCAYTTPYKKDLVRHMRKHTGEKPYACELCSKQFSRYDKLMLHTRAHERQRGQEGGFKCKVESCPYSSDEMSLLKRHAARNHSDEKPYMCQLCSYRTRDSNQLNIHIRFHTGDSPYACTMCSSAFKTSTDLRRHFRIHTQEKPFSCPHCPFSTAVKCNLTTHIKRKHPPPPAPPPPDEVTPFKHIHPKRAILEKAKRETNAKTKADTLPFQLCCKFCKYKTATIKSFKLHMVKQHKTKNYDSILDQFAKPAKKRMIREPSPTGRPFVSRFKCSEGDCTRSFVSEKSLRCHIRQHVTLHPPPAPTIEVIISASQSEGYEEATGATQGFLLLCDSVEESISVINPTETDPLL